MPLKIYQYDKCGTCKKALKFLDAKGVPYEKLAIVDTPPSQAELKKMLGYLGGDFRKLFNTSGVLYRERKIKDKLPTMSADEALTMLAKEGKLIKRPFLLAEGKGTVGFKEEVWRDLLGV